MDNRESIQSVSSHQSVNNTPTITQQSIVGNTSPKENSSINKWEDEFPILRVIKNPKTIPIKILIRTDKWIKKMVFWGTTLLIAYVVYFVISQTFATNYIKSNALFSDPKYEELKKMWMGYRNFLYLFMFIDAIFSIGVSITYIVKKEFPKIVKLTINWWLLLFYVTFSYAFAGLLIDFAMILVFIHFSITK